MERDYTAAYERLHGEHWWWRVREQILIEKVREGLKVSGVRLWVNDAE